MNVQLGKINPKFRQLTDQLLFSDRMDLVLSDYKQLLKLNYNDHFVYLWNRFEKSTDIFWEDGAKFWNHRLNFLLSLQDKSLSQDIEKHLEKRMYNLVLSKKEISVKYDIEYLQFLELCKAKHGRGESLAHLKKYLSDLPSHVKADKLVSIINSFIPLVFTNMSEYVDIVSQKITQSSRNFELLKSLETQGLSIDKLPMVKLLKELLLERTPTLKNRKALFTLLNDNEIREQFKKDYQPAYKANFIAVLNKCEYSEIEEFHLKNVKNLLEVDPSIADDLAIIYANKLFARPIGHRKANADRLIRLLKFFPAISPKKLLAYLSANNKMADIKYVLNAFPGLKKLAAFV